MAGTSRNPSRRQTSVTFSEVLGLLLGAGLLCAMAVSCGGEGNKVGPSPPVPPVPTVTTVTIVGPASVHPGTSAQYTAMLTLSDGTEKAATNAQWFSSAPPLLTIDRNTGAARSPLPGSWGEPVISVFLTLDGRGPETRFSREILVQPDGTFRLVGVVAQEDGSGIPDATLEVRLTENLSSRTIAGASADVTGRYRLYGVPPESYLHVRRVGYLPTTERIQLGSHTTRDFTLRADGNVPSFDGTYTMTVDATNCSGYVHLLAEQFRLRTYAATIKQSGSRLTVVLSEAPFHPGSDAFSGIATPTGADVLMRSFYDPYYYPSNPNQPDVVELLGDGTVLEIFTFDTARLTGTRDRLSGTLSAIKRWQAVPHDSRGAIFLGGCSNPRITLTRR